MAEIRLAEALLRRKELQQKVDRLKPINQTELFEVKVQRQSVTESVDNVIAQVPKVSIGQITHVFDWHSKALRTIDAAIQQKNWEATVNVPDEIMDSYVDPYVK